MTHQEIFGAACARAIKGIRAELDGTPLDTKGDPVLMIVTQEIALSQLPSFTEKPDLEMREAFVNAITRTVGKYVYGTYGEGGVDAPMELEFWAGRPATLREIAALKVASLMHSGCGDLREVNTRIKVKPGYTRAFGAKLHHVNGEPLYVAVTGWDPDADRLAALRFPHALETERVLQLRAQEPPPVIDSKNFLLFDEPAGGWQLRK